jgi:hypothetical protein
LSITAQNFGDGQETAASRESGLALPGSEGLAARGGPGLNWTTDDQLVPSPILAWFDPSTIMQVGPDVQAIVGSTGSVTVPVAGAGK